MPEWDQWKYSRKSGQWGGWTPKGDPPASPESPEPGAPRRRCRRRPRASAVPAKGPAQRLKARASRPLHPTASGRHGDPKVPSSGGATVQERRGAAPRACAEPPPASRGRGPRRPVHASAFAAGTASWALPGPASVPCPGHSAASSPLRAEVGRPEAARLIYVC